MPVDGVPKHLVRTLSRAKFEQLSDRYIQACRGPVAQALKDAGLAPSDIDEVILVGGSTRIPAVQEMVAKLFGREPSKGVNPDAVSYTHLDVYKRQLKEGKKTSFGGLIIWYCHGFSSFFTKHYSMSTVALSSA